MGGIVDEGIGFLEDISDPFGHIGALTGQDAADASQEAAKLQQQLGLEGIEEVRLAREQQRADLQPFTEFGAQNLPFAQEFLFDPQSQFDFLQSNPLFNLALENANRQTQQSAAARGRLSAGDTLQQLSNNVLLAAQPLIGQQSQNIFNALQLGQSSAAGTGAGALSSGTQIAELNTQIGNALAAGGVGAAQAQQQGAQNLLSTGAGIAGAIFSDRRLKTDIKRVGELDNGQGVYTYKYVGSDLTVMGVMADETDPSAVIEVNGYHAVKYGEL